MSALDSANSATRPVPATPALRSFPQTVVAVAATSGVAAAVAFGFRESLFSVLEAVTGRTDPIDVVRNVPRPAIAAVVAIGILAARLVADAAGRWRARILAADHARRAGRADQADQVSGPTNERALTAGPTFLRTGATWIGSATLGPVGREGAIIESGAAFGALVARWTKRPAEMLARTGMASAFAAAYHAPVAAVLYVEAHMDVRRTRSAAAFAIGGGLLGHLITLAVFDGHPVFTGQVSALNIRVVSLALAALIPAYAASRLFAYLRDVLAHALAHDHERPARRAWARAVALAIAAGAIVALVPVTAGNGLEGLRQSAGSIAVVSGLALCFGKLFATSAAVGTGTPTGVFSPALAVAGGAALASVRALEWLGVSSHGTTWTVMLAVMPVGVALALRAPFVALFVVAEMAGDIRLLPVSALMVAIVVALDRVLGGPIRHGHADHHSHGASGHEHDDAPHAHDLPHDD